MAVIVNQRVLFLSLVFGVISVCVTSCDRRSINGAVTDARGAPLPGVAVSSRQDGPQALTDALGRYSLADAPSYGRLRFMKTGYTSAEITLDESGIRSEWAAPPVALRRLPQDSGVYFLENDEYRPAARTEPKPFTCGDGIVYGIAKLPELPEVLVSGQPVLICYGMPSYDACLYRLHTVSASPLDASQTQQLVWTVEAPVPMELTAVDEPERLLWQAGICVPLAAGIYALTWGSLDRHEPTDYRAFLFRAVDPNPPAEPEPVAPNTAEIKEGKPEKSFKPKAVAVPSPGDSGILDGEAGGGAVD